MPTTLTLKNIPDEVYHRLRRSAEANRRSMSSEAIVCLERVLMPQRMGAAERLERARATRGALAPSRFAPPEIDVFKRKGRA
jgi:plasmid stability protein